MARTKSRSRQNSKHDYIKLQRYVEYKSAWNGYATIFVKARGTSKTCSGCGYHKDLRGAGTLRCPKRGLVVDRQRNAARNIWNLGCGESWVPPERGQAR
ncbi:MAG: zinc ribbon domain-containing protein [Candidatus Korarchaeum sp.]